MFLLFSPWVHWVVRFSVFTQLLFLFFTLSMLGSDVFFFHVVALPKPAGCWQNEERKMLILITWCDTLLDVYSLCGCASRCKCVCFSVCASPLAQVSPFFCFCVCASPLAQVSPFFVFVCVYFFKHLCLLFAVCKQCTHLCWLRSVDDWHVKTGKPQFSVWCEQYVYF